MRDPKRCDVCNGVLANDLGPGSCVCTDHPREFKIRTGDQVNHPAHYTFGKFEVIEVLEDWNLGPHLFNVVKYVARAGKKDPTREIQDLEKAAWYLNRKIELLKATNEGREAVRPNDMVKK